MMPLVMVEARAELYARAGWSPAWNEYVKDTGLDLIQCYRFCGILAVTRVAFDLPHFDFHSDGELAAVIEVLDDDSETVIDLCAWPLSQPDRFGSLLGRADGLGTYQVRNPATYFAGQHLLVHRTPLAWLKAGCNGVVILNRMSAPTWLGGALGPIAGESPEHSFELARLLKGCSASAPMRQSWAD